MQVGGGDGERERRGESIREQESGKKQSIDKAAQRCSQQWADIGVGLYFSCKSAVVTGKGSGKDDLSKVLGKILRYEIEKQGPHTPTVSLSMHHLISVGWQ